MNLNMHIKENLICVDYMSHVTTSMSIDMGCVKYSRYNKSDVICKTNVILCKFNKVKYARA